MRRAAAVVAMTALLACSGLGLCWRQFANRGHDCCVADETQLVTPAKPCAAPAATVSTAHPSAAPVHAGAALAPPSPADTAQRVRPSALGFAAKSPPLILRI